ncbi:MAG: ComEC/Rec2 family competence protein [Desulfocapsaceae bacterium]
MGALLLILTAILIDSAPLHASEELHIHLLDVGQGDAMILHQPGGCTALIDAGPLINGHRVTRHLSEMDVSSLDLVIVSHPHLDHFGGLFDLLPRIKAKKFYDNGLSNKKWEYFDDYLTLRKAQSYEVAVRGMNIQCGDIEFEVLHPDQTPNPEDNINSTSLAMMIRFKDFRLLHMGDLAGDGAAGFLDTASELGADVIKIAHHGASDSASPRLLDLVAPELALISTAANNRIGSPDKGVLTRLEKMNIPYLRTDQSGDITILVRSGSYDVTPAISR